VITRRTALSLSIVCACSAFAACSDAPTAPFTTETASDTLANALTAKAKPSPVAPQDIATARIEALRDALNRVQPTLMSDERSIALGVGLRQAIDALERKDEKGARILLEGVEQTLQRYAQLDNAMSPDVDVIRLAVRAASAR
jgi:hypothetical protein